MAEALLVRFRPAGPWRLGPGDGARTRTNRVLHSDSLYSALTASMISLGWGDDWLAATAEAPAPAIRLSSCFPYTGKTLLIPPPRTVWPPASGRVRWKAARLVPLRLIPALLRGDALKEEHWAVEPVSECVLPVIRNVPAQAPFRVVLRRSVPVDRMNGVSERVDVTACLQFARDAGMWFIAAFENDDAKSVWWARMEAAARLLADTGVGGGRSQGWGRSHPPEFESVSLPAFFTGQNENGTDHSAWWLVSLFLPSDRDEVLWDRGNYGFEVRSGRIESQEAWGDVKPRSRMVAEGSVLLSSVRPSGAARNVAELPHPVYRSGIALTIPVTWREPVLWPVAPVEEQVPAAPVAEWVATPAEAERADEIVGEPESAQIIAPAEEQVSPAPVPEPEAAAIEAETEAIATQAEQLVQSLLNQPEAEVRPVDERLAEPTIEEGRPESARAAEPVAETGPAEAERADEIVSEPESAQIIAPGEEQASPAPVPEPEAAAIEAETEAIATQAEELVQALLNEPEAEVGPVDERLAEPTVEGRPEAPESARAAAEPVAEAPVAPSEPMPKNTAPPAVEPNDRAPQTSVVEGEAGEDKPAEPSVPPDKPEEPPVEEPGVPEPPVKEPDPGPEDPDAPVKEPGS